MRGITMLPYRSGKSGRIMAELLKSVEGMPLRSFKVLWDSTAKEPRISFMQHSALMELLEAENG